MKYPSNEANVQKKADDAKENNLIGQLYNKVDTIDEFKVKADLAGFSTHKIRSIVAFYFIWTRFDFILCTIMSLTSFGLASAFLVFEHRINEENPHYVLMAFFGILVGAFLGIILGALLFVTLNKIKEIFNLNVPEK